MTQPPTLAAAMSPFPYAIEASQTLREARDMMSAHDIHHLPVTQAGELHGVITNTDILLATSLVAGGAANVLVEDTFTEPAYVVDLHSDLATVVLEMAARRISSALVTREGKLAGILTTTDICLQLGELLGGAPDDEAA